MRWAARPHLHLSQPLLLFLRTKMELCSPKSVARPCPRPHFYRPMGGGRLDFTQRRGRPPAAEHRRALCAELEGHVMTCVKDENGNHVIQKCIEQIGRESAQVRFIVDSFDGEVANLATHRYGCRVIQRVLENCRRDLADPVLNEILTESRSLMRDQYGNYVVQHVLEHGADRERAAIIARVRGLDIDGNPPAEGSEPAPKGGASPFLDLCRHKFASNVVEKCLISASAAERDSIINDMLKMDVDGACDVHAMVKDPYANYVVQKVLDIGDPQQRERVLNAIRPKAAQLKRYTYGKHILARLAQGQPNHMSQGMNGMGMNGMGMNNGMGMMNNGMGMNGMGMNGQMNPMQMNQMQMNQMQMNQMQMNQMNQMGQMGGQMGMQGMQGMQGQMQVRREEKRKEEK